MDDQMFDATDNLELEQRLDRYARVRLSPDPDAVARMRARVMREARLDFAARAQRRVVVEAAAGRSRTRARLFRRAAGLLAAAGLSVGVAAGAMAASQAGGPLYSARVALEALALPADGSRRGEAELTRLEARMHEILAAVAAGDRGAVEAALRAYGAIADEALAGAGDDAALLDRIRLALGRHVAILAGVALNVPDEARAAIQRNIDRAIEHNGAVIDRIEAGASKPGGGQQPGAGDGSADKTPKPTKPPKPADTPAAAATADPTKATKPPAATEKPGGPPSEKPGRTPPARGGSRP
jgi:hypothetical protein